MGKKSFCLTFHESFSKSETDNDCYKHSLQEDFPLYLETDILFFLVKVKSVKLSVKEYPESGSSHQQMHEAC